MATKVPREEQPNFLVKLYEEDVRLVYNAIEFYHKNRPRSSERPEYMQEPTAHLEWLKSAMMTMIFKMTQPLERVF